ncbi:MAG: NAD-dependent epimerase/dehydratase family protein, partial [Pseudomonadota bacterium]
MGLSPAFWRGRRVLLTGHTGFKGAWAGAWLGRMGAEVTGFALAPQTQPALFEMLDFPGRSIIGDLRDPAAISQAVADADPEIVIHMAAQPLVRQSYADPVETYGTNVMGTVHLLEALKPARARRILVVTSDKVYENDETGRAFAEGDRLGGHDHIAAPCGRERHPGLGKERPAIGRDNDLSRSLRGRIGIVPAQPVALGKGTAGLVVLIDL